MAEVVLENVVKRYGDVVAVNDVSLTIHDGEFVSLVGPSGCGKTTTLNMIAGLLELSEGSIFIGGRDVSELSDDDRKLVEDSLARLGHGLGLTLGAVIGEQS